MNPKGCLLPNAILAHYTGVHYANSSVDNEHKEYDLNLSESENSESEFKLLYKGSDCGSVFSQRVTSISENCIEIKIVSTVNSKQGYGKHSTEPVILVELDMTDEANDKSVSFTFSGNLGKANVKPGEELRSLNNNDLNTYKARFILNTELKLQVPKGDDIVSIRGNEPINYITTLKRNSENIAKLISGNITSTEFFQVETILKLEFFNHKPN